MEIGIEAPNLKGKRFSYAYLGKCINPVEKALKTRFSQRTLVSEEVLEDRRIIRTETGFITLYDYCMYFSDGVGNDAIDYYIFEKCVNGTKIYYSIKVF